MKNLYCSTCLTVLQYLTLSSNVVTWSLVALKTQHNNLIFIKNGCITVQHYTVKTNLLVLTCYNINIMEHLQEVYSKVYIDIEYFDNIVNIIVIFGLHVELHCILFVFKNQKSWSSHQCDRMWENFYSQYSYLTFLNYQNLYDSALMHVTFITTVRCRFS